ncbi:unnamed protein product [Acanthoscelides obtectus]|uniref:Uncharacterized protein n=1 Tax=Acanthoscelides obtectus TaxID=200917 RepID=A0A9P0LR80_ACAOB|nr:unnamed protein product [Acanthoscelides obtectus]CAK1671487.1 hypothetical protein AOBTE_LOCUS28270 [Acanthoscelides obtectus]
MLDCFFSDVMLQIVKTAVSSSFLKYDRNLLYIYILKLKLSINLLATNRYNTCTCHMSYHKTYTLVTCHVASQAFYPILWVF